MDITTELKVESHDCNIKYYQPIEMSNSDRLDAANMMDKLKDLGIIKKNLNLGQFATLCYARGLNEYRKDIVRKDV